jgi:hypothetical protein
MTTLSASFEGEQPSFEDITLYQFQLCYWKVTHIYGLTQEEIDDNFRMNTRYGRYGAAYNMVGLRCFNEELSLLPKNPTEAKLQATSTWGESTEPT